MTDAVKTDRTNSHKLLRLKRGGEWLLFSESRRLSREGVDLLGDTVEISVHTAIGNKKIMEMRGEASGARDTVSFSNGFIHVAEDWQGRRIGTYMLNRLVAWAKESYPEFRPTNIRLGHHQEASKEARNRFYSRFGFRFVWEDEEHLCGSLDTMTISELRIDDVWTSEIEEFELRDGLETLCRDRDLLQAERDGLRYQLAHRTENGANKQTERPRPYWRVAALSFLAGAGFVATLAAIQSV